MVGTPRSVGASPVPVGAANQQSSEKPAERSESEQTVNSVALNLVQPQYTCTGRMPGFDPTQVSVHVRFPQNSTAGESKNADSSSQGQSATDPLRFDRDQCTFNYPENVTNLNLSFSYGNTRQEGQFDIPLSQCSLGITVWAKRTVGEEEVSISAYPTPAQSCANTAKDALSASWTAGKYGWHTLRSRNWASRAGDNKKTS